jgi:SAM-dependent methyltransferase
MNSWSHGYPTESAYTVGWQPFFAPAQLEFTCALNGVEWPRPARGTLLELGCGRGFSANLIAAVEPGWQVLGLDYAPAHVAEAGDFATEAGIGNARFRESDLGNLSDAELAALPEADVIGIHGVWTWVDDAVRAGLLRVIRRCLKPGGLVYIGYNALPAFGADFAMQRLVRAAALQARGTPVERMGPALALLRGLAGAKPAQLRASPLLDRLADPATSLDPSYLAHEFLTDHWRPAFFADVAAAMAEARCDYAGSATLWENMPDLVFDAQTRAVHESFASPADRELVKDICLTRGFRRDIFVRGLRRTDRHAALERLAVAAAQPPSVEIKVQVQQGIAELPPAMLGPIAARLDAGPATIGELRAAPSGTQPNAAELAMLLLGSGRALPFRDIPAGHAAQGFNATAARRYGGLGTAPLALAAPASGSGLPAGAGEIALVGELLREGGLEAAPAVLAERLLPQLDDATRASAAPSIAATIADRGPIWRRFGIV